MKLRNPTATHREGNLVLAAARKLILSALSEKFPQIELKDAIHIHNGQSLISEMRDSSGKIRIYSSGGLVGNHSHSLSDDPFIVIGRKGSAGKVTFAPSGGWVTDTAYFAQPKRPELIDASYLYHSLAALDFSDDIITTAIPGINRTAIYRHFIPTPSIEIQRQCASFLNALERGEPLPILPPLPEQQRIVTRIKSMLEKVEEAKCLRQESSEKMAALIKSAINHVFYKHSSHQSAILESVCKAIIDNLHSNPEYSDAGIPCIRSSDVNWFEINLNSAKRTSEEEYTRRTIRGEPMPNDIVLVREGGGTGKAAIVREGQKFSLGQRVMMLRPDNDQIIPEFLLHQLLSPRIQDDYIASNFKGSAAPHLNIGSLRKFPILLPPIDTQQHILSELNNIYEKYSRIAQQSKDSTAELDALPASILARAFAGEL